MADVIVLHEGKAPKGSEPQPDVVRVVEELLQRAKSGDIQAIAVTVVRANARIGTAWDGSERGYRHQLMAGVAMLEHRLHSSVEHLDAGEHGGEDDEEGDGDAS